MDRTNHPSDEQQALERERKMTLLGTFESTDLSLVDDLVEHSAKLKAEAASLVEKEPDKSGLEVGS